MIKFTRRIAIDDKDQTQVSVSGLIRMGKIQVKHKTAIICILSHWVDKGLWEWKQSDKNKGTCGYPLALVRGIKLLDKMLSGGMAEYPLYAAYGDKVWKTTEIKDAIDQLALAAFDSKYHPADPSRKKGLQRMSLEVFIWNGGIKGEPQPYTHAPFLYWHENKARLNDDAIPKKENKRRLLFDSILSLYVAKSSLYGVPALSNREHNRLVDMVETLWTWYKDNRKKLHPNDRTPDIIANAVGEVVDKWNFPISIYAFTSETLIKQAISSLEQKATYIEMLVAPVEEAPIEVTTLSPTAVLSELGGDMLQNFILYGMQQNVSIQNNSVDSAKLACFSNFTLRQVLRKYQRGELSPVETESKAEDWRTILLKG